MAHGASTLWQSRTAPDGRVYGRWLADSEMRAGGYGAGAPWPSVSGAGGGGQGGGGDSAGVRISPWPRGHGSGIRTRTPAGGPKVYLVAGCEDLDIRQTKKSYERQESRRRKAIKEAQQGLRPDERSDKKDRQKAKDHRALVEAAPEAGGAAATAETGGASADPEAAEEAVAPEAGAAASSSEAGGASAAVANQPPPASRVADRESRARSKSIGRNKIGPCPSRGRYPSRSPTPQVSQPAPAPDDRTTPPASSPAASFPAEPTSGKPVVHEGPCPDCEPARRKGYYAHNDAEAVRLRAERASFEEAKAVVAAAEAATAAAAVAAAAAADPPRRDVPPPTVPTREQAMEQMARAQREDPQGPRLIQPRNPDSATAAASSPAASADTGIPRCKPQDPLAWRTVPRWPPSESEVLRQLGFADSAIPNACDRHYILVHAYGREKSPDPRHYWVNVEYDRDCLDRYGRDRNADWCSLPPTWT